MKPLSHIVLSRKHLRRQVFSSVEKKFRLAVRQISIFYISKRFFGLCLYICQYIHLLLYRENIDNV